VFDSSGLGPEPTHYFLSVLLPLLAYCNTKSSLPRWLHRFFGRNFDSGPERPANNVGREQWSALNLVRALLKLINILSIAKPLVSRGHMYKRSFCRLTHCVITYFPFKKRASGLASQTAKLAGRETALRQYLSLGYETAYLPSSRGITLSSNSALISISVSTDRASAAMHPRCPCNAYPIPDET
jgi:hypothetical protein